MKYLIFLFSIAFIFIAVHSCSNKNTPKENLQEDTEAIRDHAQETIATTFAALSGELKAAVTEGGVQQAIEYCSLNAISLTDSLANNKNVTIKRATDRPRNPLNKLNEDERIIFNHYQEAIANDLPYSDTLILFSNQSIYYKPIRINDLCLKCHGDPNSIEEYDFIKEKYPNDQATGYNLNDLRGIWCVSYDSEALNNG